MGGNLLRVELANYLEIKRNIELWYFLCNGGLQIFLETFRGLDVALS